MSLKYAVGDLTIHRVIEQETSFVPALEMLPGLTAEVLAENRAWMRQAKALDEQDVLLLCFQSYVVKTPHRTILIDSCIGNDKPRPQRPKWNMKTDDTYLRGLNAAGFAVDDIDFVMCTHLHVDHVGWNTRLENGRWVPTFPRARYVFAKQEYDHWFAENAKAEIPPFADSAGGRGQAPRAGRQRSSDRRSRPHPADARTYARPYRHHNGPRQGRRRVLRRPHAFAAADALSGAVDQVRRRSGRGGENTPQLS